MAKLRQVPKGLEKPLDGFLRDLHDAVRENSLLLESLKGTTNTGSTAFGSLPGFGAGNDGRTGSTGSDLTVATGDWSPVGPIIDSLIDSVRADPFFQFLAEKIDVINGPSTLPASVKGQLNAVHSAIQLALDAQGSSITTLQTITNEQASQITTLQTGVGNNSSAIVTLQSTTAGQALQITALAARTTSAESSITNLLSATPTSASWWSAINTTINGHSASIEQYSHTLYDAGTGLTAQYSVKLDVNNAISGFGLASNTTLGSRFYVRADRFAIGAPGVTDINSDANVPFIVQTGSGAWGAPGVYIKNAAIQNASIDNAKILSLTAGKILTGSLSKSSFYSSFTDKNIDSQGAWVTLYATQVSTSNPTGTQVSWSSTVSLETPLACTGIRIVFYVDGGSSSYSLYDRYVSGTYQMIDTRYACGSAGGVAVVATGNIFYIEVQVRHPASYGSRLYGAVALQFSETKY